MQLDLHAYARLRPYLYHVTARDNLAALTAGMRLDPAAQLMRLAGRTDLMRWRRHGAVSLDVDGGTVVLRDQRMLVEQQVALFRDWAFADFVEYMNEHVYFWPGTDRGPVKAGIELPYSTGGIPSVTIRVPLEGLLLANPSAEALFSSVNSGALRDDGGRRVPRGPHLFRNAMHFTRRPADVVEVAFRSSVALPANAAILDGTEWFPVNSIPDSRQP